MFIAALLVFAGTSWPARADVERDKTAIAARLQGWAAAFNARDAAGVCDLFASDLISTVPGALDGGRDAVCTRLAKLLANPGLRLSYHPDIREIIVAGDLAAVRLFWTLTTERGASRETSTEAGLDIFRRQPDGRWSIALRGVHDRTGPGRWFLGRGCRSNSDEAVICRTPRVRERAIYS